MKLKTEKKIKEGACGLVQKNNQRTLACVRVAFGGGDECKVDRIDGQQQVSFPLP